MIRPICVRGLFGTLTTCVMLACVTVFGHSSASAQPCAVMQEVMTAAEAPARAFPRLELLKSQDVLEFISNNGANFGFADGGEFVCVASVGGELVLMANSAITINESAYNDEQNVIEINATTVDGELVQGRLFLAALIEPGREVDESNIHLVFELSNPDGYDGVRFVFDSQTGAIHSPRCTCAARGPNGPGGPCGIVDCDEGRICGDPARPRACWWEPPNGPRLAPVDGSAQTAR